MFFLLEALTTQNEYKNNKTSTQGKIRLFFHIIMTSKNSPVYFVFLTTVIYRLIENVLVLKNGELKRGRSDNVVFTAVVTDSSLRRANLFEFLFWLRN